MSTSPSNAVLGKRKLLETKFIKIYESNRCLWDRFDPGYSKKPKRENAWAQLTKFYQTNLDPLVNVYDVKKKIDNLRTAYHRERKKVESGPSYKPTLWYYNLLTFFKDDAADEDANMQFVAPKWESPAVDRGGRIGDRSYTGYSDSGQKCYKREEPSPKEVNVMTRLLEAWKSNPCLWKKDDKFYLSKECRLAAWKEMLPIYQKLKPYADITALKKRLSNMRDAYSRVKRGLERNPGASSEPTLWYYHLIDFLKEETITKEVLTEFKTNELMDAVPAKQQDSIAAERALDRRQNNLSKFIELYKENRCLWDRNYPMYLKREENGAACQSLLKFYRSHINRYATVDRVKKKIENMRLAWKRAKEDAEMKKKEGFKNYKPQLWYFDQMSFIDQGDPDETTDDDGLKIENCGPDDSPVHLQEMVDDGHSDVKNEVVVSFSSESGEVNETYLEFIDLFKQQGCLWDPRVGGFYVQREKSNAYCTLLQFYRSRIDPSAKMQTIKNKVAQMKVAWKAEAHKVKSSDQTNPSRMYQPKMPFYDALSFLAEAEACEVSTMNVSVGCDEIVVVTSDGREDSFHGVRKSERLKNKTLKLCYCDSKLHPEGECGLMEKDPLADDDDEDDDGDNDDDDDDPMCSTPTVGSQRGVRRDDASQTPPAKKLRLDPADIRRIALEALEKITETTAEEETWVSVGRSMGQRLGLLSSEQRAVALKLMNDALFYGELGKLNEHWAVLPPKTTVRELVPPTSAHALRSSNGVYKR